MRRVAAYVLASIWFAGVILALIPGDMLPDSFKPFVSAEGSFGGKTVKFRMPQSRKATVSVSMAILMEKGVCQISCVGPDGGSPLFSLGAGKPRLRLAAGTELVLDAGGNPGTYDVFIGPKWHPLAPSGKLVLFSACTVGLVGLVIARWKRPALGRTAIRRFVLVCITLAVSGLLYSVVHEFGHLAAGVLLGGEVNNVVWTMLSGEEPHVSFSYLPDGASGWMSAGGVLLPTLAGIVLVGSWLVFSKRMPWWGSMLLLLVPGLGFLLSNVACLLESVGRESGHMSALASHLSLSGSPRVLLILSPFLATVAVYTLTGIRIYRMKKSGKGDAPAAEGSAGALL